MPQPNDACPCGSGRKYKRCHGAPGVAPPASRRPQVSPADAGFDPYAKIFHADGTVDADYVGKRIPQLVQMLRNDPACFPWRADVERLGELLLEEDAQALRDAKGEEAFEDALRAFSRAHLHEVIPEAVHQGLLQGLVSISRQPSYTRRDRVAAAIGATLLAGLPDEQGLRGRAVLDLLLRITLEERHAQEQLRQKGRETEGGLTPEELDVFWKQYPALRHHHEERYRREVVRVLRDIDEGVLPPVVSLDLGLRGAALVLTEMTRRKHGEPAMDSQVLQQALHDPFAQDMLDGGPETIRDRWAAALAQAAAATSRDRRALARTLDSVVRLVDDSGPGGDAILFYAYLRAVTGGHYHVRDQAEADAARDIFQPEGLSADGVLHYAKHLAGRGDAAAVRRVLMAALELWPEHTGVRAAAERLGEYELSEARRVRLGPTYLDDVASQEAADPGEDAEPSAGRGSEGDSE